MSKLELKRALEGYFELIAADIADATFLSDYLHAAGIPPSARERQCEDERRHSRKRDYTEVDHSSRRDYADDRHHRHDQWEMPSSGKQCAKYTKEGFLDNSGFERDMTHPLNRKLVASRGKNFTKEKQKNKNKIYSLSMESGVKSFRFSDSE
ncbi:Chain A Histidyl-Trna Synthetase (Apo) [Perkinsela sp. CCAP 1560/4]|nr:Chain A Histidyl-Trna Synthetase (Apo) [Perkinsela sp. CCAP 1560/4]|eukprot:KNH07748.1 Chain A Histidyl-Trna Synthetase (Apo) [Perkinsela sp. CCAP 1560/4]